MSVNIADFDSSLTQNHSANAGGFPEDTNADNPQQSQAGAGCSAQAVPVCSCALHAAPPLALLLTAGDIQSQVGDMVVSATRTSSLMENKIQCHLTGV